MNRIYYDATGHIEYQINGGSIVDSARSGDYIDLDESINIDHWSVDVDTKTLVAKAPTPTASR
jgi:hypothetical protein